MQVLTAKWSNCSNPTPPSSCDCPDNEAGALHTSSHLGLYSNSTTSGQDSSYYPPLTDEKTEPCEGESLQPLPVLVRLHDALFTCTTGNMVAPPLRNFLACIFITIRGYQKREMSLGSNNWFLLCSLSETKAQRTCGSPRPQGNGGSKGPILTSAGNYHL